MRCLRCNGDLGGRFVLDPRPNLYRGPASVREAARGEFMCPACWEEVMGDPEGPRLDDSQPLDRWSCCGLFYAEDPTPGRIVGRC